MDECPPAGEQPDVTIAGTAERPEPRHLHRTREQRALSEPRIGVSDSPWGTIR
ncbi:hypothetical protein QFZ58_005162 [Streptomyces sp. B1I3]|nr:hypothetical protein [Streptomyces sp. B1I3]